MFTFNCNFIFSLFIPFLILPCAFEQCMKFAHYKCCYYHYYYYYYYYLYIIITTTTCFSFIVMERGS